MQLLTYTTCDAVFRIELRRRTRLPQACCYLLLLVVFDHPFTINSLLFWDNSICRLVVESFNQKAHYSEVLFEMTIKVSSFCIGIG